MTAPVSSDAPHRAPGTHTRSGNAMGRTRTALLSAAAGIVQERGVKAMTMGLLATSAGVAKATLYNHFRTKDAVLAALVEDRVDALGAACVERAAGDGLAAALEVTAAGLAADPALRAVAAGEPALLLALLAPGQGRGWDTARTVTAAALDAAGAPSGPQAVELVLRWLVGQVLWPAGPEQARVAAAALTAGLMAAGFEPPAPPEAEPAPAAREAGGLGWPAGHGSAR